MDLGSMAGAWKRLDGDMRDEFRNNYIHEHHFARIKFPVFDLRSLAYTNSSVIDIVSSACVMAGTIRDRLPLLLKVMPVLDGIGLVVSGLV
jgi:hypothetical protein